MSISKVKGLNNLNATEILSVRIVSHFILCISTSSFSYTEVLLI